MGYIVSMIAGAIVGVVATLLVMIVSYDKYKEKR